MDSYLLFNHFSTYSLLPLLLTLLLAFLLIILLTYRSLSEYSSAYSSLLLLFLLLLLLLLWLPLPLGLGPGGGKKVSSGTLAKTRVLFRGSLFRSALKFNYWHSL